VIARIDPVNNDADTNRAAQELAHATLEFDNAQPCWSAAWPPQAEQNARISYRPPSCRWSLMARWA